MKRIIIVCEGQTEQSFCNDVLQSHFNKLDIFIENPTTKKIHGGIVNWAALKRQIERHLLQDSNVIVTTLIDYYGVHQHHEYPLWVRANKLVDKNERMTLIENAMLSDVDSELRRRFIPYIQLHEFEGLLFFDIEVFNQNFNQNEFSNYAYIEKTISENPNPELINNHPSTAASKRLQECIKGYDKPIYGFALAECIGLTIIRAKCPRFNDWITKLESI